MHLRKRVVGAASVALAAGTMIAGASLTTAAIASPQQDPPEMTVEQLAQDGSGVWYSCTVPGGFADGGLAAMASKLNVGEAVGGIVQADGTVTELSASESATLLEEMEAPIPGPDESDVRAGSKEECANLETLGTGEIDVAAAVAMVEVGSRSDDFTAELLTEDEAGEWISCPLDMSGAEDAAFGVFAGEVEESGLLVEDDAAMMFAFPEPADIRPGTDAECAELGSLGDDALPD